MKRIIPIILMLALLLVHSCVRDRSNTYERVINELQVQHPLFGTGITLMQSDPLLVEPEIISNLGLTDESNYSFEWMAIIYTFSPTSNLFIPLSTERDLNISTIGAVLPANTFYTIRYRVIDNTTGVFSQVTFSLRVNEAFSSGWLVMNEIGEEGDMVRMRLDMLEIRPGVPLIYQYDVLLAAGSQLPMEARGRPIGIRRFSDQFFSPNNEALYILTETGSNRISPITFREVVHVDGIEVHVDVPIFSWRERWSIRNHFLLPELTPEDLVIENIGTHLGGVFIAAQGNIYYMQPQFQIFFGDPVNRLVGGGPTFTASHHIAGDGIVFDLDSRSFRQVMMHSSLVQPIDESAGNIARFISYQNMTNYELIAMFDNTMRPSGAEGVVYIIMRNNLTGRYWLMQSSIREMRQDIWEELGNRRDLNIGDGIVSQNLISQAAQQERPLFLGGGFFRNIFYFAVGGTIYAYDIAWGTTVPVVERPGKTVTFMSFVGGGTLAGGRPGARDMLVGFWDGTQGTLEQFEVQNREFIPMRTDVLGSPETNFGKIIDVLRR